MDPLDIRNVLMTLEWSRRFSFICTLILTVGFVWLTIFLVQRFHVGLFMMVWISIADICIIGLLIPVIYRPYKKSFDERIIPDFIKSKSTYLSLCEDEEIDRIDFMASQFYLKVPDAVWCNMVLEGINKGYKIKCAKLMIGSTVASRQGGMTNSEVFCGTFIIATPESLSGKVSCIEPEVLVVPQEEPYVQDVHCLEMAISADSESFVYNATRPIPNGVSHSMYSYKLPLKSLCIPPKQIRVLRKKAEQIIYEDPIFNDAFTVYAKELNIQSKLKDSKFKQLLLKAKDKNRKGIYFSKFNNVIFAAFESEKDDFEPPFFTPINEKIIEKLDSAYQKTLEEINETIEIAEYLK